MSIGKLSKKQTLALELIEKVDMELSNHSGIKESGFRRWFIQEELHGITLHTMKALVEKGYLEEIILSDDTPYYRVI